MPFPDEVTAGVIVHPYRPEWPGEAAQLAGDLQELVPDAIAVEHIGSTAVPGMAAKDCLDLMVIVQDLGPTDLTIGLVAAGYRQRGEPWNLAEPAGGRMWPKKVFAPPVGSRSSNIHLRAAGSASARLALLFRDHLRSQPQRSADWSELKVRISECSQDLETYGQIKLPAWRILMELAERWAQETGWQPPWTRG